MNAIEELVHYCKEPDPIGALMLTGEWGSGKTHLIENDLVEALGPDYAIVRVSLFGINDISSLSQAVRRKWISVCYPFMNRIEQRKEIMQKNSGFVNLITNLIKRVNPIIGATADLMNSVNITDTISIEPEFEDLHTHKKRKSILVFDDMERCNIKISELLGVINECCENLHFNTIVLTNLRYLINTMKVDRGTFNMLKEKAISQTVLYQPDYQKIIHRIISTKSFRSEQYRQFLEDNEKLICNAFDSKPIQPENGPVYEKSHNLLTLIMSLQSFYRVYHYLKEAGISDMGGFLYSYLAYMFCHNNGIIMDGEAVFDFTAEDIRNLYPQYSDDMLFASVRNWIETGVFDKELFNEELKRYKDKVTENKEQQ